jgi:prevent-host-death family protein
MMTIIGLKELSQNAGKIADRVAKGETFTVVKRSKPVFSIVPTSNGSNLAETEKWTREYVKSHQSAFDELAKR